MIRGGFENEAAVVQRRNSSWFIPASVIGDKWNGVCYQLHHVQLPVEWLNAFNIGRGIRTHKNGEAQSKTSV